MQAMILAAGRGERLRPLTDKTPKPLLEAGGKPLIVRTIERLAQAGFTRLVVNLGYRGRQIEAALGNGSRFGVTISYSREPETALETGGGIHQALPLLGDPFLVVNGDIATDFPFSALPSSLQGTAHLVLVPNPDHHPEGDFGLVDGIVTEENEERWTYSGIGLYRHEFFRACRPGRFPLAPLLRRAIAARQVSGQLHTGFWSDIGTIARLAQWQQRLQARETGG